MWRAFFPPTTRLVGAIREGKRGFGAGRSSGGRASSGRSAADAWPDMQKAGYKATSEKSKSGAAMVITPDGRTVSLARAASRFKGGKAAKPASQSSGIQGAAYTRRKQIPRAEDGRSILSAAPGGLPARTLSGSNQAAPKAAAKLTKAQRVVQTRAKIEGYKARLEAAKTKAARARTDASRSKAQASVARTEALLAKAQAQLAKLT